jgi:hypothetical protein
MRYCWDATPVRSTTPSVVSSGVVETPTATGLR